ncbi:MAG: AraC family transcriptional regulator [bacterium]|nr:AraC family transcriptional regulator [bacterium]
MQFNVISTDDTLRENAQHGSLDFPFAYYLDDIWNYDFHCINWHWHHELEFVSASKGTVICLIGQEKIILPEGHGLFINSGIIHRFETPDGAIMPNIVFSPTLLSSGQSFIYKNYVQPIIQSNFAYQIFDPQCDWQNEILQLLSKIYETQEQSKKPELHTLQLLLQLWELLTEHIDLTSNSSHLYHLTHQQAKLQLMMQFIRDHYQEDISLNDIAAYASISKSRVLQIFKSGIQLPPIAYLIQYRLSHAASLLQTTTKPISTIAVETGFTSAAYFCRKFKEAYQMRPNEYRTGTR